MSKSNAGHIIIRSDEPNKIVKGSKAQAELLVHEIARVMQELYPNYMWHVQMSPCQSVIGVRCLNVCGEIGFIVHTTQVQNDPSAARKLLMRYGGELLERGFMSRRNGNDNEDFVSKIMDVSETKFKMNKHKGNFKKRIL